MSFINASSLRYVLNLSILSRLTVILIQFISNVTLTDHNAIAYRNRYRQLLDSNATSNIHIPDLHRYIHKSLQGLTNWDSQYFLEISVDGYTSEQHLAFLPLYPLSISFLRQILFDHHSPDLKFLMPTQTYTSRLSHQPISTNEIDNYIKSALIGVTLNNFIFFPIACTALYVLTKLVKNNNENYARNVAWWFCFNPASIFFSSCYSESLFAATTFTAMMLIEYKSKKYNPPDNSKKDDVQVKKKEFVPMNELNRLLSTCLPSLGLIALSTATRSNGLVTTGFIWFQIVLKYVPLTRTNRTGWTVLLYVAVVLEWLQDLLVILIASIISISGYVTFQIYSYIRFCLNLALKGETQQIYVRPTWCDQTIPHAYGYVQAKYWDVGPFKYYKAKQLPNFLLALPITYLVLSGSLNCSLKIARLREDKKQLAYYLHGIILTIFCGISINVQVITRLIASSCPVIYWICADLEKHSLLKKRILLSYCTIYLILGSILHSNFYPWT